MTCRDHATPVEDCCGCHGWDPAMAERAITTYGIDGVAAATIRAAVAEIDAHSKAATGEHVDGASCLECEVRSLRRQLVAERLAHETTEQMRAAANDEGVRLTLQRYSDLAEAAAIYEAMRAEIEGRRIGTEDLLASLRCVLAPAGVSIDRPDIPGATDPLGAVRQLVRLVDELRCGDLGLYFDGELSTERRDAFDKHLATCEKYAAGLLGLMHEDNALSDAVDRRQAVLDAAVAWMRTGGSLAAIADAVNALEDG